MRPIEPDSPSLILRATTILALRIDKVDAGSWRPTAEGWNERSVALGLFLAELLKGEVKEAPASRFAARVSQFQNPSPIYMPVPGPWSDLELAAGTTVVVFAVTRRPASPVPAPDAASLLIEPACIGVEKAEDAAAGVRLSMRYLTAELSAAALLEAAATIRIAGSFAALLGELLRHDDAFAEQNTFRRFTALLPRPGLEPPVRAMLIDAAVHAPAESGFYSTWHVDQVIIALFRTALAPEAAPLRANILGVDLPPLLGLRGGHPRTAAQVFKDQPALREEFAAALRRQRATPALVGWLEAPG